MRESGTAGSARGCSCTDCAMTPLGARKPCWTPWSPALPITVNHTATAAYAASMCNMHTDYQTAVMQTMTSSDYGPLADTLCMLAGTSRPTPQIIGQILWHVHALLSLLHRDADWVLGGAENESVPCSFATLRNAGMRMADTQIKDPVNHLRVITQVCSSLLRSEYNMPLVECYRQNIAYLSQSGRLS